MQKLEPGDVFANDYRVERALAQGGMGAVYVALQASTGRRRALKLMHPRLVADERLRARFEREARVGADIPSDHVVEVVAAGVDDATGSPYLVMELLEGEDLHAYVSRRGALPPSEVAVIAAQIAHGLGAAHAAGIVHRDLKPENVFLVHEKREGAGVFVKVLDFGIAKATTDSSPASHTAPVGTPLWMAPEQASAGSAITPATDVWAFGLLVYWMLTARIYWRAAAERDVSAIAVLKEVAVDPLPPASARAAVQGVGALLPDGFDTWFDRCVVRQPAARWTDASEARRALSELFGDGTASARPLALAATVPGPIGPVASSFAGGDTAHAPTAPIAPTMASGDLAIASPEAAARSGATPGTAARAEVPGRPWLLAVGAAALLAVGIAVFARSDGSRAPVPALPSAAPSASAVAPRPSTSSRSTDAPPAHAGEGAGPPP